MQILIHQRQSHNPDEAVQNPLLLRRYTRRTLLRRAAALGGLGLMTPVLLSACGGNSKASATPQSDSGNNGSNSDAGNSDANNGNANNSDANDSSAGNDGADNGNSSNSVTSVQCSETAELTASQTATRKALGYVDVSQIAAQKCNNCRFFKVPATGVACGTCEIVPGPISPEGYCSTWVARGS